MAKNISTLIKAAEYLDRRDKGTLSRFLSCIELTCATLDMMPRNGSVVTNAETPVIITTYQCNKITASGHLKESICFLSLPIYLLVSDTDTTIQPRQCCILKTQIREDFVRHPISVRSENNTSVAKNSLH